MLVVKNPPVKAGRHESWVQSLWSEDPLGEGLATHSRILAWRIPRTEKPGQLWSIRSQSRIQTLKLLSTQIKTPKQMQITYTLGFKTDRQTKGLLPLFPSGLGYLGWCHIPGA